MGFYGGGDAEPGDASISEAPAWFKRQIRLGKKLPCIYTSLSNVNALHTVMENAGISRDQYRIWSAHYTGIPHICGPQCERGLSTTADGTQYWDKALGRNQNKCSIPVALASQNKDQVVAIVIPPSSSRPDVE